MKAGFTKDGKLVALDMYTVVEGGPYGPGGDGNSAGRFAALMYSPERCGGEVSRRLPTRRRAARRASPAACRASC
jgi:hypothetical protein